MKPKIINLKNILLILFFLSGACALTYQVIWVRMLNQIFGVNAFAVATVLGAFMAGLALGNHYFGKLSDRHSQPLKLFAYLQFFIGLFALCSPLFFSLITNFYAALHKQFYSNWGCLYQ
jgi:spermidine synthase